MLHPIVQEDLEKISQNTPADLSSLKGQRVLVTGASGMLPGAIVDALLYLNETRNANIKILGLVRNLEKARRRFGHWGNDTLLELRQHDVSLPLAIHGPVDVVIHAASQASPKYYGQDPVGTLLPNIFGTRWLLDLARDKKSLFFLFSSAETYGQLSADQLPVKEGVYGPLDPLNVRSCYAEAKRMAENMCASWAAQYGVRFRVVRPFHTYGPGMLLDDGRVFADFVSDVLANRNIRLFSDGTARRAYCYLSDAVMGFLTIILKGEDSHAYNLGNPDAEVSVAELAEIMVSLFPERRLKVEYLGPKASYLASNVSRIVPNSDKLIQLGWKPVVSVAEGFRRTVLSCM